MRRGIGQSVARKEDERFVTGAGAFTDDLKFEGELHAVVVRSVHAHAVIRALDRAAAVRAPGVVAIFTGADAAADGLGHLPIQSDVPGVGGAGVWVPPRPILQAQRVRYVGDPVALVVAATRAQALDAAELVHIDYEVLPAITDTGRALDAAAPVVWPERGSNLCLHWQSGDRVATDAAFARAAHVVELDLVNNRLIGNPMEPRVAVGLYEPDAQRYVLHSPTQGALKVQYGLATHVFKVPTHRLRVVSPDVGGSFGLRGKWFPESALVLWAARRLGRPVRWCADRQETMLADPHGRDHVTRAALALDVEARILGLRVRTIAAMGAYLSDLGPRTSTVGGGQVAGTVYAIPAIDNDVRCVFTNNSPTDSYRGAGRPEAAYVIERLLDAAAWRLGLPRDEIRRRNFVPPAAIPYRTAVGSVIDSGRFGEVMERVLVRSDWAGFEARRAESARAGRLRGIGLGCYLEASGGLPTEWASVRVTEDGAAIVTAGTFSHGQGHETTYAQIVESTLGVPFDRVTLVQGDTDRVPQGSGTGASRSSQMGGMAVLRSARVVLGRAMPLAAELLEADVAEIETFPGGLGVKGTDHRVGWSELAARLASRHGPEALAAETLYERPPGPNFPNGCHVAEVEIDPDTGVVTIVRYTAVDDAGRVINPMIVHGQAHGAVAMGIGQALLEHAVYDATGQLLSGSFLDYAVPRAHDIPAVDLGLHEVPNPSNDLGVKGAGEGGSCGAPPAIVSAALDALRPAGVTHVDMPLTPARIWRALRSAGGERLR